MGKPRSKAAAEVVARKKKRRLARSETKNNPFEVRVNRRKYDVLGQKFKSGRGLPGVARSRAVQKVPAAVRISMIHFSLSVWLCVSAEEEDVAARVSNTP